jgi:hypothetical protein
MVIGTGYINTSRPDTSSTSSTNDCNTPKTPPKAPSAFGSADNQAPQATQPQAAPPQAAQPQATQPQAAPPQAAQPQAAPPPLSEQQKTQIFRNARDLDQNNQIRKSSGQKEENYGTFLDSKAKGAAQEYKDAGMDKDGDGIVDKGVPDSQKLDFYKNKEQKHTAEREQIVAQGGDTTEVDAKIERSKAMQESYSGKPQEGKARLEKSNEKLSTEIDSLQSQAQNESNPEKKQQLLSKADNLIWERTNNTGFILGLENKKDPKTEAALNDAKATSADIKESNDIRKGAGQKEGDYGKLFNDKVQSIQQDNKDAGLDKNGDGMIDKDVSNDQIVGFYKNQEQKYTGEREKIVAQGGDTTAVDAKIERSKAMQEKTTGKPQEGKGRLEKSNEKLSTEIDNLQGQAAKESDPNKQAKLLEQADVLIAERMHNQGFIASIN